MAAKRKTSRTVETLRHDSASRRNIPTAEHKLVMAADDRTPIAVAYARRNQDLDPQLVWRGKDQQNWSDLGWCRRRPCSFRKIHPKVLIHDLLRHSRSAEAERMARQPGNQTDLFADFNGLPDGADRTEFYQHEANWSNRMILGDSLQVMASLVKREGLRGRVQCIYIDPPYGIKFNSNFQWSTTSRDVKDGKAEHITREPEQVKAFRDTWRDGIHSYLTYLRDWLTAARDSLTESGSIFVQIGDENVHRVQAVMDEVFGDSNHVSTILFTKTSSATSAFVPSVFDSVVWYARTKDMMKFRSLKRSKSHQTQDAGEYVYLRDDKGDVKRLEVSDLLDSEKIKDCLRIDNLTSQSGSDTTRFEYYFQGQYFCPGSGGWKTNVDGMKRLDKANRL